MANSKYTRILKQFKITLVPSLDFIPYMKAEATNMCEFYFLCFRFNLYYPLKSNSERDTRP